MCEEKKNSIKEPLKRFNEESFKHLHKLMEKLLEKKYELYIKNVKYYVLQFGDNTGKFCVISGDYEGVEKYYNASEDYVDYHWAEFVHNDIPHKLSMFIKAFDRYTGNLQIIPGVPELWKADNTDNGHFIIYEGRSCDWKPGFPEPYSDHKGGKLYCEKVDGKLWVPLLEKENEKKNKTVSDFFYSPESSISLDSLDETNKINGTFTSQITDEERKQYKELSEELKETLNIGGKVYTGPAVLNFTQWQFLTNKDDKNGIIKKKTRNSLDTYVSQYIARAMDISLFMEIKYKPHMNTKIIFQKKNIIY